MKFIKRKWAPNALSSFNWPNWEYFSLLLETDKDELVELMDLLAEMVWDWKRGTETALVYDIKGGMDRKFAIKEWDLGLALSKAENFDEAVEIFFKHPAKFTKTSDIASVEEYFEIYRK